jgi:hypothetical protein
MSWLRAGLREPITTMSLTAEIDHKLPPAATLSEIPIPANSYTPASSRYAARMRLTAAD